MYIVFHIERRKWLHELNHFVVFLLEKVLHRFSLNGVLSLKILSFLKTL